MQRPLKDWLISGAIIFLPFVSFAQNSVYLDSLDRVFRESSDAKVKCEALYGMGKEYSISSADTAILYFKQALQYAVYINDIETQSAIAAALCQEYRYKDPVKSAEYAIRSVELAEKTENKEVLANAYASMGGHYTAMGDLDQAEKYIKKSMELSKTLGDTLEVARRYNGLGIIHMMRSEYEEGEEYWRKSIETKMNGGYRYHAASTMTNLAIYYKDIHRYYEAKELLDSAIYIERSSGDYTGIAFSYRIKGEMYNKMENYHQARTCFDSSLHYYDKAQDDFARMDVYMGMSYALEGLGKHSEAIDYLRNYISIYTKSYNESQERVREELESKYETKRKEEENLRLQAENELKDVRLEEEEAKRELQQTNNMYLMIGLFVAVFVLIGIIYALSRMRAAKQQLEIQKDIVEEKNKEITDSISYAKRLQEAILPSQTSVDEVFPENFVYYKPKDIVAGDFYWLEKIGDRVVWATADCTGHGVPGAMVSVVCSNALNRSVHEFGLTEPGKILDKTTDLVIETFEKSGQEVRDGMDIALCSISRDRKKLKYSGANNSLYLIRKGALMEVKAMKQPIGKYTDRRSFKTHDIELQKGDVIYLFSDGYADQFGGEKGKKMKYKPFKSLLVSLSGKSMPEQKEELDKHLTNWMGNFEQIDDVCVVGVRV